MRIKLQYIREDLFGYFIYEVVGEPQNRANIRYSEVSNSYECTVWMRGKLVGCKFHPTRKIAKGWAISILKDKAVMGWE